MIRLCVVVCGWNQLTGKSTGSDQASAKSPQELHSMLVAAMSDKQQALVVLDDPWMPEQVRFLNPIDGVQNDHRLLVTTRIRDLVPKATRGMYMSCCILAQTNSPFSTTSGAAADGGGGGGSAATRPGRRGGVQLPQGAARLGLAATS